MVMMVVVMAESCMGVHMAMGFVAMLPLRFQFQGRMADAVFKQFLANFRLDFVGIRICDDMHGGIIALPIHAPDMNMVDIQNPLDPGDMRFNFLYIDTVGRFFKEQLHCLL